MGTPTHTYCSLRDLLKNQPSPPPKFKNHPCAKTRVPELEDIYKNTPFKLSILESLSPSKEPSFQTTNGGHGKGKMCATEKPQMVDEKSKQSFVKKKINIVPQDVMLASGEDEELKETFANGAKEDAEKTEMANKKVVKSEKGMSFASGDKEHAEKTETEKKEEAETEEGTEENAAV